MNNLLYITANSKPEHLSSSKTVSRIVVNRILDKYQELKLEELDLYFQYIPRPKYHYFSSRSAMIDNDTILKLSQPEQNEIQQMIQLCDQFISASIVVFAAPMWSLSFPGIVKDYIDSIILKDKTIAFENNMPKGLLNDKQRTFIYVQASGANIPFLMKPALNKGGSYLLNIIKFLGFSSVEELLVDGTGTSEEERLKAISKAKDKIDNLLNSVLFE
jgi:FMN-dependent NADH-azoreductase